MNERNAQAAREPAHGTRWRYQSAQYRCRCDLCRKAQAEYRTSRLGCATDLIEISTARQHLEDLVNSGSTLACLSRVSGIPRRTLARFLLPDSPGKPRRMKREHVDAVLALTTPQESPAWVDSAPVRIMLRKLIIRGWSQSDLSKRLGYRNNNALHRVVNGRTTLIKSDTVDRVTALYEQLKDTPGPSASARSLAQKKWDENGMTLTTHAWPHLGVVPTASAAPATTGSPSLENGFYDPRYDRQNRAWPKDANIA